MSTDRPQWDAAFWDERYSSSDKVWSGHVNAVLEAEAASLEPGRALDVGCGEGGDALWLARQGWEVLGVDVSQVAVERATQRAATVGLSDRAAFAQRDLLAWTPDAAAYDLVTAAFIHLDADQRARVYAGLAAAVAPGGSFLVMAHHGSDAEVVPRPPYPDLFFTPEELLDDLRRDAPGPWDVVVAEARPRTGHHPETHSTVRLRDTVLHARRTG